MLLPLLSPPAKFRGYLNHGGTLQKHRVLWLAEPFPIALTLRPTKALYEVNEDPAGELVPSPSQVTAYSDKVSSL